MVEYRQILASDPSDPAALCAVLDDCRKRDVPVEAAAIAERALAEMPSAFVALDAPAWALIAQGEHARARLVVERALRSLDDTPPEKALDGRFPHHKEASADTAQHVSVRRSWGREYLVWWGHQHGEAPSGPPR
jgi:hypothetical protein